MMSFNDRERMRSGWERLAVKRRDELTEARRMLRLVRAYVQVFGFHESALECYAAAMPNSDDDLNAVVIRKLDRVLS